jgi:hypothetical protein
MFLRIAVMMIVVSIVAAAEPKCDNPVWFDNDLKDIQSPKEWGSGYYYDFLEGTFFLQTRQAFDFPRTFRKIGGNPKEAYNVNCEGGVPDSSWFTNRNGKQRMSVEKIRRGFRTDDGPSGTKFIVTRGKTAGITPGFWIRDEKGNQYIVKFDPPKNPELATGAEIIAGNLFYAIGYNVPQNTLIQFRPEQLSLDEGAKFTDDRGVKRKMVARDLEVILSKAAKKEDGSYRAIASKLLPGKPLGGFKFSGTRKDDPNDIIPHEHRREVRGLRVFSAWLEHNDIRVGNSLDVYVEEGGRGFVRHYLIDFGSTLGSDTAFPNVPIVGHEHQMDMRVAAKVLATGGIYQPGWRKPKLVQYPGIGIYSAEDFDPRSWRQNFPLAAFENMTEADARWAAEIIASFTNEQIWAAVDAAEFSDRDASEYLKQQLIARRDIIERTYIKGPTSQTARK